MADRRPLVACLPFCTPVPQDTSKPVLGNVPQYAPLLLQALRLKQRERIEPLPLLPSWTTSKNHISQILSNGFVAGLLKPKLAILLISVYAHLYVASNIVRFAELRSFGICKIQIAMIRVLAFSEKSLIRSASNFAFA